MPDLTHLTDARAAHDAALAELRADWHHKIRTAAGEHGARAVADALGMTRQRVYQILRSQDPDPVDPRRARLRELDEWWNGKVDAAVKLHPLPAAYTKSETARRNVVRGKVKRAQDGVRKDGKRSGSVSRYRSVPVPPTVLAEHRALVEDRLLAALQTNPDDPLVQSIVSRLEERETLRQTLTHNDQDIPF